MVADESRKRLVQLSYDRVDIPAAYQFLQTPGAGGVAVFVGTARQWTGERETLSLTYESYEPMAFKEMHRLIDTADGKWPIQRVCLLHKLGEVHPAEASVLVGVATAHRAEAFVACRFLIDQLKAQVPIWKQERLTDGQKVWMEDNHPQK